MSASPGLDTGRGTAALPEPTLVVRGEFGEGLADLVADKTAAIAAYTREPVLSIRVALDRLPDPGVTLAVAARVTVDVNGRTVHASAIARTASDAMDLAIDRVTRKMADQPRRPRRRAGLDL